ncbi:hypothetical protein I4F81_000065 [Pyropia yezoensis]|uniref:Uncharacterized protein n=1 Tax=Pyropia yezoensis TaxID=2788 RepID=A0ACC3BIU1_PYRYE|nr:hypothetical protein I4F81_000065 [Neopyropia yezoensis]
MGSDAGNTRVADAVSAIDYVTAAKKREPGAKIILNASFGFSSQAFAVMTAAAIRAAEAGVLFVTSAGNVPASACFNHPAMADGVIAVAAMTREDELVPFSARGTRCVAASAPGVDVLSVDAPTAGGLKLLSGTSMASPHVAGLIALVLAEDPDRGALGWKEVLGRLTRSAPRVGGFPLAWANPDAMQRVDASIRRAAAPYPMKGGGRSLERSSDAIRRGGGVRRGRPS